MDRREFIFNSLASGFLAASGTATAVTYHKLWDTNHMGHGGCPIELHALSLLAKENLFPLVSYGWSLIPKTNGCSMYKVVENNGIARYIPRAISSSPKEMAVTLGFSERQVADRVEKYYDSWQLHNNKRMVVALD